MTDLEFQILDELYLVQSYIELRKNSRLTDTVLVPCLIKMFKKGWIRVLTTPIDEAFGDINLSSDYANFYYFASKDGLLAHNSK